MGNNINNMVEVIKMSEMILNTETLTEHLFRLIRSKKVIVREADGEIRIIPFNDGLAADRVVAVRHTASEVEEKMQRLCELTGSCSSLDLTVDSFIAMTHDEKEIYGE
jgi:hypothetical protein